MRIRLSLQALVVAVVAAFAPIDAAAEEALPMIFEDFETDPASRWTYVADGVMGGVSDGQADMVRIDGAAAVRLTGQVSTQNNGGFVQVRHRFEGGLPANAKGLRVSAKGNDETYYVFLRTAGLARVWYSYRFAFDVSADWAEFEIDFDQFKASHAGMPETFRPDQVIGIGLVAYGKDYVADLTVRAITLH